MVVNNTKLVICHLFYYMLKKIIHFTQKYIENPLTICYNIVNINYFKASRVVDVKRI